MILNNNPLHLSDLAKIKSGSSTESIGLLSKLEAQMIKTTNLMKDLAEN